MKNLLGTLVLSIGATIAFGQASWTGSATAVTTSSACGIGTNTPLGKLQVHGNNSGGNTSPGLLVSFANAGGTGNPFEVINYAQFGTTSYDFVVGNTGVVAIKNRLRIGPKAASGAAYLNYALSVDGDMIAKRCVIQVTDWADYVFSPTYALPSLAEVEQYITKNNHLPGVPSKKEVLKNGVEVGEMNEILLKKIEELTLYTIKLQKELDVIKAKQH